VQTRCFVLLVIGCFLAGWSARHGLDRPALRRPASSAAAIAALLERYVLNVAVPALVLVKLPDVELGASVAVPVAVAWGGVLLAAGIVVVVSRLRAWDRPTKGALLLVTPLGNTSFLGLATVEVLLGRDHLGPALAFDQLGSFLALAVYGSVVASRYGAGDPGWRPAARRLLRFGPFLALLASIPLRWIGLPDVLHTALGGLGRTVAPVAMLAIGLRFRLVFHRRLLQPALCCLITKMVVLPTAALAIAAITGVTGDRAWQASILQVGMPPMVTAGVVAAQSGLDEELATFVVGVGTLLAFVTAPLLAVLIRR
jgi:predicted permease